MPVHLGFVGSTGCIMIREAKGAKVFYTLSGEKGRNVLLLHGWGCDSSTMKSVANALEDHFQVRTPDFPGHGKSGRPPEPSCGQIWRARAGVRKARLHTAAAHTDTQKPGKDDLYHAACLLSWE